MKIKYVEDFSQASQKRTLGYGIEFGKESKK